MNARHHVTNTCTLTCTTKPVARGVCVESWNGADVAPDPPVTVKARRSSLKLSDNIIQKDNVTSKKSKCGCVCVWERDSWHNFSMWMSQLSLCRHRCARVCVCVWRMSTRAGKVPVNTPLISSISKHEVFVCSCSSTRRWGFCPRWVTASPSSLCSPAPSSCVSSGKHADVRETCQLDELVCLKRVSEHTRVCSTAASPWAAPALHRMFRYHILHWGHTLYKHT